MPLPRAVQEAAERADALHAQMYGNTTPAPVGEVRNIDPPAPAPQPEPAPAPTPEPQPTAATESTPQPSPPPDSWELKYRVLEGKYRSEVPRLHDEVRQLKTRNQELEADVTQLRATPAQLPASVVDQYGEEFATAVATVVREATQPLQQQLEQVNSTVTKTSRATFMTELSGYVPNFAEIDQEPGFTAYLDAFDPMTGRTRREFFNEADATNDAPRIASFFKSYEATKPRTPQPQPTTQAVPPVDPLLVPDSSRSTEVPQGKKQWTRAEIARFYAQARPNGSSKPFGLYTAAEYAQIDNDIQLAVRERRLIG